MSFGIKHATCHTNFIGGSCWMMTSFTEDLSNELSIINSIAVDKKGKLKVFEKIFKFCQNHATAKQLRQQFF